MTVGNASGPVPFDADVAAHDGYLYTTNARLSSVIANRRLTDLALTLANFRGRRVIDVGCGDGTYTLDLATRGGPAVMHGVDPAREAIRVARQRAALPRVTFEVAAADALPAADDSYDLAHLRGVLHHMADPAAGLREALRVAPEVIVIEPNGYNPGLKVLERASRYHREHGERSFAPPTIDRWIARAGGTVVRSAFAGLVPFFCPDALARALKAIEPAVERTPGLRALGSAVYVVLARRREAV